MPVEAYLLVAGLLVLAAVASSRAASRLGVPALLIFVGVGMLAGSEGIGGIQFEDYSLANFAGTLALAVILYAGGFDTSAASIRANIVPVGVLATVGVAITGAVVAIGTTLLTGIDLRDALLLGAVVSSTDAAAVFSALRGQGLPGRLRRLLEAESGSNDPMAVFLTLALTDAALAGSLEAGPFLTRFLVQMGLGGALGIVLGRAAVWGINRARLDAAGLYPVLALAAGILMFGLSSVLGGNGFITVYIAGVVLGNARLAHRLGITAFLEGMSWLMQIMMFLILGLLSFPSRLVESAPVAVPLALVLVFVARPVAVWLTLVPLRRLSHRCRFTVPELTLLSWAGLKGAVPIILAMTPLLAGVENGALIFDTVFFSVLVSVLVQGSTIALLATKLGLARPEPPPPPVTLEISGVTPVDGEFVDILIDGTSPAANKHVRDLNLPTEIVIAAFYRDGRLHPARGSSLIRPGDHVYVIAETGDHPRIIAAFTRPPSDDGDIVPVGVVPNA